MSKISLLPSSAIDAICENVPNAKNIDESALQIANENMTTYADTLKPITTRHAVATSACSVTSGAVASSAASGFANATIGFAVISITPPTFVLIMSQSCRAAF